MTPGNTTTCLAACWAGWMALVKMMKTIWNFKRGDKPTFYLPFSSDLFFLFTHSSFLFFVSNFSETEIRVCYLRSLSGRGVLKFFPFNCKRGLGGESSSRCKRVEI